jgi:hypothetical protein
LKKGIVTPWDRQVKDSNSNKKNFYWEKKMNPVIPA